MVRLTTSEFIIRAKKVHDDKYDYSKVDYVNGHAKVDIICDEHGIFKTIPYSHTSRGIGCPRCKKNFKDDTLSFIKKARGVHNNKYDYSKVSYIDAKTKVKIICATHGVFEQEPKVHINIKSGCPRCKKNFKDDTLSFIKKARGVHNNKYDYSQVSYMDQKTKVKIICTAHGTFEQSPSDHLHSKSGCPRCNISKGELQLSKLLESNSIDFVSQKTFDDFDNECKNKRLLPFDFYLPTMNILIEFDGVQHFKAVDFFGGEKSFQYTQQNDKIKNQFCITNNIRLYRIKYDDDLEEAFKAILLIEL